MDPQPDWRQAFDSLLVRLSAAGRDVYGNRLVSLVVFGSVGRGTMRPDSDVDLLVVARDLPKGRIRRVQEFETVESRIREALSLAREHGVTTRISPVFKTPEEVQAGSPLFLDMVEDARMLVDEREFMSGALASLRDRLHRLGARRLWRGDAWLWDLKPDYQPGEIFEL